jgi:hypothetical protein
VPTPVGLQPLPQKRSEKLGVFVKRYIGMELVYNSYIKYIDKFTVKNKKKYL